jgi:hypothetical protein
MIRHENADAMVLSSALMRGIHPWTSAILNIIRGRMPLISALARSRWRQHFDDELRLSQNHRKNQEIDPLFVFIL